MSHPIGIVYDEFTDQVQLQILRDLMLLARSWEFCIYDPDRKINPAVLDAAGLVLTEAAPKLFLVYKTGPTWPSVPEGVSTVRRDLMPHPADLKIDPNPHVGYFLKEQGRDSANLTERYLGRSAPRGIGFSNFMVQYHWG